MYKPDFLLVGIAPNEVYVAVSRIIAIYPASPAGSVVETESAEHSDARSPAELIAEMLWPGQLESESKQELRLTKTALEQAEADCLTLAKLADVYVWGGVEPDDEKLWRYFSRGTDELLAALKLRDKIISALGSAKP